MAGLSGFSYHKTITISHDNVDADLSNYPVYVPIVNDTDIGDECLATGYDIQFADATNDNVLTFERLPGFAVSEGSANGDFYVLVPTVAGASNTVIRCYYGKADATDASSPENTFSTTNGWAAVWHLEESGSGYLDATSNSIDSDAQTAPTRVAGLSGYGQDFEASSAHYIRLPDHDALDVTTAFSVQLLAKRESATTGSMFSKMNSFRVQFASTGRLCLLLKGGGDWVAYESAVLANDTNWHYMGFTVTGTYVCPYVDATADTDISQTNNAVATTNYGILGDMDNYGDEPFDGILDEVRLTTTQLSDAWHKFTYYNMQDGHAAGNELAWGGETATGPVVDYVRLRWTK